jgi:hypothetical protein
MSAQSLKKHGSTLFIIGNFAFVIWAFWHSYHERNLWIMKTLQQNLDDHLMHVDVDVAG